MKEYQPAEGSRVAAAIAYLREHGPQSAHTLGQAIGTGSTNIGPLLLAPMKHGVVLKRGRQRSAIYLLAEHANAQDVDLGVALQLEGEDTPTGAKCAGSAEPQDFKLAAWNDGDLVLTGPGLRIMADDQGNAESVILSAQQAAALVRFVTQPRVVL